MILKVCPAIGVVAMGVRPNYLEGLAAWHVRRLAGLVDQVEPSIGQIDQTKAVSRLPKTGPYTPALPGDVPDIRTADANTPMGQAKVTLLPSGKVLNVNVAESPAHRDLGLQNRTLGPDGDGSDGMLFKWPEDTSETLTGRNVTFPVGAVWFDSSGMYVDHARLLPGDGIGKTPRGKARYALQVHGDAADALGFGPGVSMNIGEPNKTINLGG